MISDLHKAIERSDYYSPKYDMLDINVTMASEGQQLMQISRNLAANNAIAKAILHQFKGMLVGKNGYGLQPIPLKDYQQVDRDLAVKLDFAWNKFCEQPVLNNHGLNYTGFLNLLVECWLRDGDCFVQIVRDYKTKKMQLKMWLADKLPYSSVYLDTIAPIELDDNDAPLYYNFVTNSDLFHSARVTRVPAQDIIQLAERREPGQLRGVPVYASVVPHIAQLESYRYYELASSAINAQIFAELNQTDPALASEDVDIDLRSLGDQINYFKVPNGYEYKVYPAQNRTNPNYDNFYKAQIRTIASGVGLDSESISNHFESSYSAARQSMIYASARSADKMNSLVQANKLIYRHFVQFFFEINPELDIQDYLDPFNVTITTPQMKSINPADEANATVTLINNGLLTRQQAANEQGYDIFENYDYIASERQYMEERGLGDLFTTSYGILSSSSSNGENIEEKEEDEELEE
ncbi:phage portal protein [Psittacicella hinzii]|uniref:phage portal protein n=1 Tax=Psittacicella hinzii TaxID=2028575 RepID=UPI001CA61CC9|nr:phage portal protein [Psittacicella hinzii]